VASIVQDIQILVDTISSIGGVPPVWQAPITITVDDNGNYFIPANANRTAIKFSNKNEDVVYVFGDYEPEKDIDLKLKKKETAIYLVNVSGTGKIRFKVTKNNKYSDIKYQEAI